MPNAVEADTLHATSSPPRYLSLPYSFVLVLVILLILVLVLVLVLILVLIILVLVVLVLVVLVLVLLVVLLSGVPCSDAARLASSSYLASCTIL